MTNKKIGATTEVLFCEVFAAFVISLVFLTLRYRSISREGTITKERDSVFIALAITGTAYAMAKMI